MFNSSADSSHWMHIIEPELWEASALVCDIDPRKINVHRDLVIKVPTHFSFYSQDYNQKTIDLFYSILEISKRNLEKLTTKREFLPVRMGVECKYQIKVLLIDFVTWAKPIIEEKGHKVPNWLLKLESKRNNIANNQQTINKETADKINIDEITTSPLTLQQLLKRPFWNQYTPDNIYELANKGKLGLYYKISNADRCLERKTYHPISQNIRSLLNQKWLQDPANNAMLNERLQLQNKFIKFIKNHKLLLKHKIGYVRLATATEVEISPLCAQSSVDCFLEKSGIDGQEWNNYFGFVFLRPDNQKQKKRIISPAYFFHQRITENNLVVFTTEIEAFEQRAKTLHQEDLFLSNTQIVMSEHGKTMAYSRHTRNREIKNEVLTAYKTKTYVCSKTHICHSGTWKTKAEAAKTLAIWFPGRTKKTIRRWLHELEIHFIT